MQATSSAVEAPPPRRTQAQRRERAERRLLDAALAIVARRGSVRMTLAEVGVAAGYSRGLPAQHFGSKAGLLRALAAHIGVRFREQREAAPARRPGLDAIRGAISVYFGRSDADWTSTRALLVMMTEGLMDESAMRDDVVAYNRSSLAFFEAHLRIAVDAGEVSRDVEPAACAVILLGAMRGVMLQALSDEAVDLRAVRDLLLSLVDRLVPAARRRR
ncbi:MAG: TetR/AcrR family transcriptional regulator [Lautropia sp.]